MIGPRPCAYACTYVDPVFTSQSYNMSLSTSANLSVFLVLMLVDPGCVRLRNVDLDFENPDFEFAIEREIRKRISTLRYLFLDFLSFRFLFLFWKFEKGFEKQNRGLARASIISKRRPLFTRIVLKILFRISQSNGKK